MPNWAALLSQWCVCLFFFLSLSYLRFFILIPSPTALATYIIPVFIPTAWLLSLSILHMLSLTNTSQNILNWFCFGSNFFFFLALLFKPQRALSSAKKGRKRAVEMKTSSITPSSLYALHSQATCCLVYRKQSDFLRLMRKQEIGHFSTWRWSIKYIRHLLIIKIQSVWSKDCIQSLVSWLDASKPDTSQQSVTNQTI